jgi:hypothetical protein
MPRIELTYEQVLEALKDMTREEREQREQLEADLQESQPVPDYPALTAQDPLWDLVGAGMGSGDPVARQHDEYLYQRD